MDRAERPRRRRLAEAGRDLWVRLRTEGGTPGRQAGAVALGLFIGCLPLYGAHLVLCFTLAGRLGLNRLNTYLAAHVNNPLSAPFLLTASFMAGYRVLRGTWPASRPQLASLSVWDIGRETLVGSLLVGIVVAALGAVVAWRLARPAGDGDAFDRRAEEAAARYLPSGIHHWEFVRGKLHGDPLYREVLRRMEDLRPQDGSPLDRAEDRELEAHRPPEDRRPQDYAEDRELEAHRPPEDRRPQDYAEDRELDDGRPGGEAEGAVVDLGCGRGLVLALLAGSGHRALLGVERRRRLVAVARRALGGAATIEHGDLAAWTPPAARTVLLLDVLHYLDRETQERVVAAAAGALLKGGLLLLREADAGAGARFLATRLGERLATLARGAWGQRFAYRSAAAWADLLAAAGLTAETIPLSQGTPFANVLLVGRRPPPTVAAGAHRPATDPRPG
jgi:uncharacterized protein (DUF2062 family)/SAM-dependent methyltransferase